MMWVMNAYLCHLKLIFLQIVEDGTLVWKMDELHRIYGIHYLGDVYDIGLKLSRSHCPHLPTFSPSQKEFCIP